MKLKATIPFLFIENESYSIWPTFGVQSAIIEKFLANFIVSTILRKIAFGIALSINQFMIA